MDCPSFSETLSETLAAWGLPETLLDGVDPDARPALWKGLVKALEASEPPAQGRGVPPVSRPPLAAGGRPTGVGHAQREPLPFLYQHYARPRFQRSDPRDLDLAGWHKKVRLALWMAAEALETLRALPRANEYLTMLAEQCAWMGQLYADLKRRAGPCFAPLIFQGELRFLQHRASAAVTDLLFAA